MEILIFLCSVKVRCVLQGSGGMQIEFATVFNGLKEASLQQMFFLRLSEILLTTVWQKTCH